MRKLCQQGDFNAHEGERLLDIEAATRGVLLKKDVLKNIANFTGNTCV